MGPILFTIYVNDLQFYLQDCLVVQYADDTQFLHAECLNDLDNLINRTEESLNKVHKYFLKNGLLLNESKTGNKQLRPRIPDDIVICFNDTRISPTHTVKNLGLYLDGYMLFDHRVNEITKKVIGTLAYISRVSGQFDKSSRIIVVQALVLCDKLLH